MCLSPAQYDTIKNLLAFPLPTIWTVGVETFCFRVLI